MPGETMIVGKSSSPISASSTAEPTSSTSAQAATAVAAAAAAAAAAGGNSEGSNSSPDYSHMNKKPKKDVQARASLSEFELINLTRLYNVFDEEQTGFLLFEEVLDLLKSTGLTELSLGDLQKDKYRSILDPDGNGVVEFYHLVQFYISCGRDINTTFRGLSPDDEEKHINAVLTNRFTQYNTLRIAWDLLILAISAYYCIRVHYEWYRCRPLSVAEWAFETFLNLFLILDIGIQVNTMYYDEAGKLVDDLLTIFKNYFFSWMLPDVLGAFPCDLIMVWLFPDSHCEILAFLIMRSFRQMRLVRVFVSLFGEATVPGLLTPQYVYFQFRVTPVLKGVFFMVLMFHMLSVGWLQVSDVDANPVSYNNWERDRNVTVTYVDALYFVTYSLTTVGYGDIYVETQPQKIYCVILCFFAAMFNGLVISQIGTWMTSADIDSFRKERMRETLAVLQYFDVQPHMQSEVLSFQSYVLEHNLSSAHRELYSGLPSGMQEKIVLAMRLKLIGMVPLFVDLTQEIKTSLADSLVNSVFCPGQFVIIAGEQGQSMFFLGHGVCDVIAPNGKYIATLRRGNYFGEIALFVENALRTASIKSLTYCDVFCLSREDFLSLMGKYTTLRAVMEKEMLERIKQFKEKSSLQTIVKPRHMRANPDLVNRPYTGVKSFSVSAASSPLGDARGEFVAMGLGDGGDASSSNNASPILPGGKQQQQQQRSRGLSSLASVAIAAAKLRNKLGEQRERKDGDGDDDEELQELDGSVKLSSSFSARAGAAARRANSTAAAANKGSPDLLSFGSSSFASSSNNNKKDTKRYSRTKDGGGEDNAPPQIVFLDEEDDDDDDDKDNNNQAQQQREPDNLATAKTSSVASDAFGPRENSEYFREDSDEEDYQQGGRRSNSKQQQQQRGGSGSSRSGSTKSGSGLTLTSTQKPLVHETAGGDDNNESSGGGGSLSPLMADRLRVLAWKARTTRAKKSGEPKISALSTSQASSPATVGGSGSAMSAAQFQQQLLLQQQLHQQQQSQQQFTSSPSMFYPPPPSSTSSSPQEFGFQRTASFVPSSASSSLGPQNSMRVDPAMNIAGRNFHAFGSAQNLHSQLPAEFGLAGRLDGRRLQDALKYLEEQQHQQHPNPSSVSAASGASFAASFNNSVPSDYVPTPLTPSVSLAAELGSSKSRRNTSEPASGDEEEKKG